MERRSRPGGEMVSVQAFANELKKKKKKIIPKLSNLKQQSFSYLSWYHWVKNLGSSCQECSHLDCLMWLKCDRG